MGQLFALIMFYIGTKFFNNLIGDEERESNIKDQLKLQHDAQDFNADQAAISRMQNWAMFQGTQPDAMYKKFKSIGASENAALQAALGVSPSGGSPVAASSSSGSALGSGITSLLPDLMGQIHEFVNDENVKANTAKIREETKWVDPLNSNQIDMAKENLKINQNRLKIDQDQLKIAERITDSTINKNQTEIEDIKRKWKLLEQELKNAIAEQRKINSETNRINADTSKINSETESVQQSTKNLQAEEKGQLIKNYTEAFRAFVIEHFKFDPLYNEEIAGLLGLPQMLSKDPEEVLDNQKYLDDLDKVLSSFGSSLESSFDAINAVKVGQADTETVDALFEEFLNSKYATVQTKRAFYKFKEKRKKAQKTK